jgi:hypothetical protein
VVVELVLGLDQLMEHLTALLGLLTPGVAVVLAGHILAQVLIVAQAVPVLLLLDT